MWQHSIMARRKIVLILDSTDPERLAGFWTAALDYRRSTSEEPYVVLVPTEPAQPELVLQRVPEPKTIKNRMHLDIRVAELDREVARLEDLGARRLGSNVIVQGGVRWVVMADPEGNEFCVGTEPDTRGTGS